MQDNLKNVDSFKLVLGLAVDKSEGSKDNHALR